MDAATNKASNAGNADGTGTNADLRTIKKTLPLRVFTPEQFEHWQTYGFAIIPQVIPKSQVDALKSFLWEFQEMDADDPEATWQWQSYDSAREQIELAVQIMQDEKPPAFVELPVLDVIPVVGQ